MWLSKTIRLLQQIGLIARSKSLGDGRIVAVALSSEGEKIMGTAVVAVEKAGDVFFNELKSVQIREFQVLMRLIVENVA